MYSKYPSSRYIRFISIVVLMPSIYDSYTVNPSGKQSRLL